MTSDAKIGVLLGLVFIFVIAFIINGLPSLREDKNNNELTINGLNNSSLGLAQNQRSAREAFKRIEQAERQTQTIQIPSRPSDELRFEMPIPDNLATGRQAEKTVEIKPPGHSASPSPAVAKDDGVRRTDSARPALPKVYVVCEDDNLAVIAKKFYGPEEGNRKINTDRIFQANRKVLKSPDEVYVGQKLIIPPLPASASDESKAGGTFSSAIFEKVKSIGRRHPSNDSSRIKQSRVYIVQEDDNLWRIATKQLGDGSRYNEIVRLNADILEDEDFVPVGMRLKMPAR